MANTPQAGRFTTGSTMRHVAVMTLTGSLGLSFMFLIDFATLFYISLLGHETLTAGVGFAWAVQFFTISAGIGLSIAALALVSRAIGAREMDKARRMATASIVITVLMLSTIAIAVLIFRRDILTLIDATGASGDIADRFLLISVPSLPFVGLGMITSTILRATGDAKRSMYVTMVGGLAAMVLDPLLIFALELGVDGAAFAIVLSRMISSSCGLYFCIKVHNLLARPSFKDVAAFARPYAAIAAPGIATQLSTPFGNFILTRAIADYGDSAVAGWAVTSRLTVLAFGGIFALSGAIGGIIGQNYGAKLGDRVGMAYRDSMIFAVCYVLAMWVLLVIAAPYIVAGFSASGEGADVMLAFCYIGAGGFMFNGLLFVANAAFNNLNHPLWSTGFNWTRDAIAIPVLLLLIGGAFHAPGIVYIQTIAAVLVGSVAVVFGWRLAHSISFDTTPPAWKPVPGGPSSARAATVILHNEDRVE